MKFNKIMDVSESEKRHTHKNIQVEDQSIENIADIKVYDNVAVYLMKPGTKGNFKTISTLANNGESAISWSIRVFFTNGIWQAHIAPHPEIDKNNIKIDLPEMIEDCDCSCEKICNLHMGKFKSADKSQIEKVVNYLIDKIKNDKIEGIEEKKIHENYEVKSSTESYSIVYQFEENKESNLQDLYKFIELYLIIKSKNLEEADAKLLENIRLKKIDEQEKQIITNLSQQYLSQSERIKVAIKYIK